MMHRKKKACIVTFIVIISIFFIYFKDFFIGKLDTTSINPIIDSSNTEQLPKNFRMCNSYIKDDAVEDLSGLSDLNISGSGQFSENSLDMVKNKIGSNSIIIVDLKQEDHGFINGTPISWVNKKNTSNKGLTKEQILDNENNKLSGIENNKEISIQNQKLIPTKVQNENELVENKGMSYIRIPVTDKEKPSDDMVDYFVQFVQSLPQNTWVHFHCEEGLGRTTTFMAMYDIMKNAKKVNLEDIMNRQVLIGGQDLLDDKINTSTNAKERAEFIKKFYEYSLQNNNSFKITWSQWLKTN